MLLARNLWGFWIENGTSNGTNVTLECIILIFRVDILPIYAPPSDFCQKEQWHIKLILLCSDHARCKSVFEIMCHKFNMIHCNATLVPLLVPFSIQKPHNFFATNMMVAEEWWMKDSHGQEIKCIG